MILGRPLLVVGFTPSVLSEFGRFLPDDGLVLVEEPDSVRKRDVRAAVGSARVCRELIEDEFLLPGGADRFFLEHRNLDPLAVIPAHDYAVPAAARIAERYGLPGASLGAAEILRDKHLLRVVAAAARIGNPASRPVSSAEGVREFQAEIGGPVIIKPANRQAAIGTLVVHEPAEIDDAWAECVRPVDETCLPDRAPELRMLVEQFVSGDEFSVEMLYSQGKRAFTNVTAKSLYPGPRPVERGHLVPAPIPGSLTELLVNETDRLLAAIDFRVGLVHCEWIVDAGRPYLVECAGRQPGDSILQLVQSAYDFDLFRAYVDLMSGTIPDAPTVAVGGAVSWFGTCAPGEVRAIAGVEAARALPGVKTCNVTVEVGQTVSPLRSSWDRTVAVTACAGSVLEARTTAQQAVDLVTIETVNSTAPPPAGADGEREERLERSL